MMFHPTSFQPGFTVPEGTGHPSQGLPVGIKPITLLAIQFSKTDCSP
jgi:hypothetical protein